MSLDLGATTEAPACLEQGVRKATVVSTDFLADVVWTETLESLERVAPPAPPARQALPAPEAPQGIVGRTATTALLVCAARTAC